MLDRDLIEKKKHLDKILNNSENDFDLFRFLREECERIEEIDDDIILNFEKAKIKINKTEKKIKSIITFDKNLQKIREFYF